MRASSQILCACAAVALVGSVAWATSLSRVHHLTVPLPGGGVAQISYTGNAAPKIALLPDNAHALAPTMITWSPTANRTGLTASVAQHLSAPQKAASLQKSKSVHVATAHPALKAASLNTAPVIADGYALVSASANACTLEIRITNLGNGAAPEVISHQTGNCAAAQTAQPDTLETPPPVTHINTPLPDSAPAQQHI